MVFSVSRLSALSVASVTGRSASVQPTAFLRANSSFCDWPSVSASWTEMAPPAGASLLVSVSTVRPLQDEDVAEDDARRGRVAAVETRALDLERGDDVDVVVALEGAAHQLVAVAVDLDRAEIALELSLDPGRLDRLEAVDAELLARVDGLGDDEVLDLRRLRDRARHDGAAGDLLRTEELLRENVGAGRAGVDLVRGDVDGDARLVLLHGPLVIGDVEAREQGCERRQADGEDDISEAIRHGLFSFLCRLLFDELDDPDARAVAAGPGRPWIPSQITRVNQP